MFLPAQSWPQFQPSTVEPLVGSRGPCPTLASTDTSCAVQVRQVRLFQDEEIYSDLYLTVCEWPSDASKVIVFGFK